MLIAPILLLGVSAVFILAFISLMYTFISSIWSAVIEKDEESL